MFRNRQIHKESISSLAQSCPTLCDPMDCSMPDFPVHHKLPELVQTHVHWVKLHPSHLLLSPSPPAHNLSQPSGSFPVSQFFTSGGQSIGVSASASVLPMSIQDWFPLGLTGLIKESILVAIKQRCEWVGWRVNNGVSS